MSAPDPYVRRPWRVRVRAAGDELERVLESSSPDLAGVAGVLIFRNHYPAAGRIDDVDVEPAIDSRSNTMGLKLTPIAVPYWTARMSLVVRDEANRAPFARDLRRLLAEADEGYAVEARGRSGVERRAAEVAIVLRFPATRDTADVMQATAHAARAWRGLLERAGDLGRDRLERCGSLLIRLDWSAGDALEA